MYTIIKVNNDVNIYVQILTKITVHGDDTIHNTYRAYVFPHHHQRFNNYYYFIIIITVHLTLDNITMP